MRKGRKNRYDVIDGQQRLTTIALIISALKNCGAIIEKNLSIHYESREKSQDLLNELFEDNNFNEIANQYDNNIDFEHMLNTYNKAMEYFRSQEICKDFIENFGENSIIKYW